MRHFTAVTIICAGGWVFLPIVFASRGFWIISTVDVVVAVAQLLTYLWARRLKHLRARYVAAHVSLAMALIGLVISARLSGDAHSLAVWFLGCIPLAAAYITSWRAAAIWGAISAVALCGIAVASRLWPLTPELVFQDFELFVGQALLLAVFLGFVISARRLTDAQFETLGQREQALAESAREAGARAEELAIARDEAVRASKARGQFLANMSHEIRTPLNGVIGMTSLLQGTPLLDSQRDQLRTIASSGQLLLGVVNDILDFSRLESGGLRLEKTVFDLGECLDDVLQLFAPQVSTRDVELEGWLEEGTCPLVHGDSTRVRQILSNLVGNAVKFTHVGEVTVRVRRESESLHFEVRDTGIGISPEVHERLFHPFTQGDASTTRRYGGSGLGLAITRQLAELMGGSIWVESTAGEGCAFHVTIVAPEAAPTVPASPGPLVGRRFLLLEPRLSARSAFAGLARATGAEPLMAMQPSDLPDMLAVAGHLDACFLAGSRPEVMQAVEIVRARRPSLPVVLLARAGAMESLPDVDAAAAKPLSRRQLVAVLDSLLTGRVEVRTAMGVEPLLAAAPLRVLVVDDNPVNQQVAIMMLRQLGYAPDAAQNGLEALAAIERSDYDLILMDVQMPEMDGVEATRRIRLRPGRQPYIATMTASVLPAQQRAFLEMGADDFIGKPVEISCMRQMVARALRHVHGDARAAQQQGPILDPVPLSKLRSVCASHPERFNHMIDTYLGSTRKLLDALNAAHGARDASKLGATAHSLKSSSALFGSARVSALAAHLEALAEAVDWDEAGQVVAAMEDSHQAYSEVLQATL